MADKRRPARTPVLAAMLAALVLMPVGGHADEPQIINAFSIWQGQGHVVQSGPQKVAVVGAFGGAVYVETNEGPVEAGTIVCPAVIEIDLESAAQKGIGGCTFTADDGAQAYGEWECAGIALIGCRGVFKFTGGVDRLAGVTATGTMLLRGRLHELARSPGDMVAHRSIGIAVWRDLKVQRAAAPAK